MGLIIGQGTKSGGGGGDVRLETNHNATLTTNGTHVVTPQEGYDGMRKATIKVDVEAADPTDKALVQNATQYGLSHNLYKVMEQVKADSRTQGYAAIMLCQYYKGYNSLSLEGGADAFLTSDGDFYQGNAVHYWHDSNDEMFDRWVAMLFSSESGSYTCSNASLCPRAALIDGTMGDIEWRAANMRFAWIDVTEGSSFGQVYCSSAYINAWNRQAICRGMREIKRQGANACINTNGAVSALFSVGKIGNMFGFTDSGNTTTNLKIEGLKSSANSGYSLLCGNNVFTQLQELYMPDLESTTYITSSGGGTTKCADNITKILCPKATSISSISRNSVNGTWYPSLIHFEIGQGFSSNFNIKQCSFANCLKTDANDLVEDVVANPTWSNLDQWLFNFEHLIVDKLADLSGQTAKTITLAATPYAAITSEIRSKMSAKNWNLASA